MRQQVTIPAGSEWLAATLHLPPGGLQRLACTVMVPDLGVPRAGPGRLYVDLADLLAERGQAALRLDLRGSGESAGRSEQVTWAGQVEDLRAACAWLRAAQPALDPERVALLGHGQGAAVAALAVAEVRASRLALWSPVLPQELLQLLPGGYLPPTLTDMGAGAWDGPFLARCRACSR
ncbi:alpha/beta fold hydrolase [Deinococcus lacus]|uniref:Alpha/beta fold hydrolase n=1 Tax=Deinococcus lacus TaxID=392561 RepID=A0ABW1YAW9_9DEIO